MIITLVVGPPIDRLHHQLTAMPGLLSARTSLAMPRTPRFSDIASYAEDSSVLVCRQLRWGLLGARTSPATPGTPRCSDIASDVGTPRSFVLGHSQRCRGLLTPRCLIIASDTRDSSVHGHHRLRRGLLAAWMSLATPRTPRCSDIASYVGDSSMLGHR